MENNSELLAITLMEEEDDDMLMLTQLDLQRSDHDNLFKTRRNEGYFNLLLNGHLRTNDEKFREFLRLNKEQFNFVLSLIKNNLKKIGSNAVKYPISPEEKLAVTLRYMATGESFRSLAFGFRISHSYISIIIRETLKQICTHLMPVFIPPPTHELMKEAALDFWKQWNFPHCVSAIDGKHVRIVCLNKSGSLFFNYKDFSMVLLAMVDGNCKFVAVDVGSYGKEGDSGIFTKSAMGKQVYSGKLFPPDQIIDVLDKEMPFVIVGDEAFRLHKHVMKPYTKVSANSNKRNAIYNYRLSRARRVSENAFGLLSQVFRVFYTPIAINPSSCEDLILSACCLHNLLRSGYLENNGKTHYEYDASEKSPMGIVPLTRTGGFAKSEGFEVREQFNEFFNSVAVLYWQNQHVSRLTS